MTAYDLYHELIVQGFSLSVNGGKLDLAPSSRLTNDLRAQIRTYKADLMALVANNDHTQPTKYTHLITCQQCDYLTSTGYCREKTQYKPMPEAMRDCASFEAVSGERVPIANVPYTLSELNNLLSRYAKKLFNHLLECKQCHFEAARYCPEAFMIGNSYDALLLVFDDAASKKEAFLNAVIKARLSGRSVFESFYNS